MICFKLLTANGWSRCNTRLADLSATALFSGCSHQACEYASVTHSCKVCSPCRYVHAQEVFLQKEKELMKDVPGYKIGENLYSGGRWMPPAPRVGAWGGA